MWIALEEPLWRCTATIHSLYGAISLTLALYTTFPSSGFSQDIVLYTVAVLSASYC